jgi:hypothetical protein
MITWFINRWSENEVPEVFPLQTYREKETLTIGELQFESVNDFNYLGSDTNSENKVGEKNHEENNVRELCIF